MPKYRKPTRTMVSCSGAQKWSAVCKFLFAFLVMQSVWVFVYSFLFLGGGGAMEGRIQNGHYFAAKKIYLTEVSQAAYCVGYALQAVWIALLVLYAAAYLMVIVQRKAAREQEPEEE